MKKNIIYQGDCLTVLKDFPDDSIDLVFTSPPYNMRTRIRNGKYMAREKTEHFSKKYKYFDDALSIEDYEEFHTNVLNELLRVSKIICWNVQLVTGNKEPVLKIIGKFAKNIKEIITWDKGHGQPAMREGVVNKATEFIIIFEKEAKPVRCFTNYNFPRGELNDIWRVKRAKSIKGHSALFPIELVDIAINSFSKKGDLILDPFIGTGSTAISAINNKRHYIGIELIEEYKNIALARIKEETK